MKKNSPGTLRAYLAILVPIGLCVSGYFIYMSEQGNFHPITPDVAYRSAQMDRDELEFYLSKHKIKSVLNLRGEKNGSDWYEEETDTCRSYGVQHYNLRLSARKIPSEEKIHRLVEIFSTAPRPILIHCKAGADRSGLAAALWKFFIENEPKEAAVKQLSIFYGHLPFGEVIAMDKAFEKWASRERLLAFLTD